LEVKQFDSDFEKYSANEINIKIIELKVNTYESKYLFSLRVNENMILNELCHEIRSKLNLQNGKKTTFL
jgi:hypothetical protein